MYKISISDIEEKIDAAKFAEDEVSNRSLNEIFKALCKYTNDVSQKLINDASIDNARKREDSPQISDVFVALLPVKDEAEYNKIGLFRMDARSDSSDGKYRYERVFLDCEYDEILNFDGKKYKDKYGEEDGAKFYYELEFDDSFLKAQEILFDYAEHYDVKNPVVWSPYSRKSFFVKYVEQLHKDVPDLDSRFKKSFKDNNIPVIEGKDLYWNIERHVEERDAYDATIPYGDATKFIYRFKKTNEGTEGDKLPLILPLDNQAQYSIEVDKDLNWVDVVVDREIEEFTVLECKDYDFDSEIVKKHQSKWFNNFVDERIWKRHRIQSEGDIERAIACFRSNRTRDERDERDEDILKHAPGNIYERGYARCERSKGGESKKEIDRYTSKYLDDRKAKEVFNEIRKEYVDFKEIEDKKFLVDFVSFVLEYLEYCYPEIKWIGVK